jgi:putative aminopeptidase FrvX
MRPASIWLSVFLLIPTSAALAAESGTKPLRDDLEKLTNTVGVSGYETSVGAYIRNQLAASHPKQDAMGNITVEFGSGLPHRLLVAPMDEPGYVVSKIEKDGYLRVQRLPQTGMPPHYNEMQNAQPMVIGTRSGGTVAAVSSGLSIHLTPGRKSPPDPDDLDVFYIDMGTASAAEVMGAGVDVLSPIAAERHLMAVGKTQWTGTAVGDRFGAAVLLQIAQSMQSASTKGTTTLAFVAQQWTGSRGLTRILQQLHPDELIYLGRGRGPADAKVETLASPGSGVLIYNALIPATAGATDSEFQRDLEKFGGALHHASATPLLVKGSGDAVPLPSRTVHLGVPLLWPMTAGEVIDERDLDQLVNTLSAYLGIQTPVAVPYTVAPANYAALPPRPTSAPSTESILKVLTLTYGVSGQEKMPREAVAQMLPPWAHPVTDASGNLILKLGTKAANPGIVFIAHTDELGFRVRAILPDGRLDLENKGGGSPAFYWGHPALVHTSAGSLGGVVALPEDYTSPQFHFPADFRVAAQMYVGAVNPAAVAALGIKVGDMVTIPKRYLPLQGKRVSVRSLDDRVGCAALVRAVWELGPTFKRNVTFVWSTREELGLEGASEYAAASDKAGDTPATVFAIDTFVSSDSPIESQRFADAVLGEGFVIRSIDGSNIVPWKDVQRLQALARQHKIPVQYGVTGGGNDGAAFQRFGAIDVALSWPLRYSHSPAEVIDTRDLDALAAITSALAMSW